MVLKLELIDYCALALYFLSSSASAGVCGSKSTRAGEFLTSGREVPLDHLAAFLAANIGAQEMIGMCASGPSTAS